MTVPGGTTAEPTDPGRYHDFTNGREPPALTCCTPRWSPWPSGWKWAHHHDCGARDGYGGRRASQRVEVPVDAERIVGGRAPTQAESLWHPFHCRCSTCAYVAHHMDDDDDDGVPRDAVTQDTEVPKHD